MKKIMENLRMYRIAAAVGLLSLSACDDFVEVDMPASQLTAEGVFQNTATANAAMANIYAGFRDAGMMTGQPAGLSNLLGGYADELDYYGTTGTSNEAFFENTLLPENQMVSTYWSLAYNHIYAANAVLEGVGASSSIPDADKNRLKGEALFARAWLHFYLLNLYGDVPFVSSTNYAINSRIQRMPAAALYSNLIADLEQAVVLLPDTYNTVRRIKPNKWVAQSFLARVFLYAGQWAEASNAASAVLNNTALFNLNPSLDAVFLRNSGETIWQLQPLTTTTNTHEAASFIFLSGPPSSMALSPELMAAIEPGDLRQSSWTMAVTNGNQVWHHAYKYKQVGESTPSRENSILMRLAELYLIRAEARARQGELTTAKEYLNAIRLRAGLPETLATTQPELLQAILQERRVELFTELGHRFFDLKRFGMIDDALDPIKPNWEPTDALLPIPETELTRNPSLGSQNPGY